METPLSVPMFSREDCLSDECKELLSTLPKEKGWMGDTMYLYEGFWYLTEFLEGVLGSRRHFQARDSDTILVTSPKSGSTWLMAMAYALLNRSKFSPGHDHGHPLLTNSPHDLVPSPELRLYCDANDVPDLSGLPSPRLFHTHLPIGALPRSVTDSTCKLVYLCRNPRDVFVSMYHFFNKLKPQHVVPIGLEHAFDMFCDGKSPYGPFWDHVLEYWRESIETPSKVLFLKYEDLKEQSADQLRRIAEFLGCPFSEEEEKRGVVDDVIKLCSFDHLRSLEVNKSGRLAYRSCPRSAFFRKGEVGDSANFLTPEMRTRIDRVTESKLGDSGLKF